MTSTLHPLSPWALSAVEALSGDNCPLQYSTRLEKYTCNVYLVTDGLWLTLSTRKKNNIGFRLLYTTGIISSIRHREETDGKVNFYIQSPAGHYAITISFHNTDQPAFRYTTTFTPRVPVGMPFSPRDILVLGQGSPGRTTGTIHMQQVGTRSGLLYFSVNSPAPQSVLYLQNLTALADYCEQTETECKEVVGGQWPELGFALPPATDKALEAGKAVVIADAIVALDNRVPSKEPDIVEQYFNLLAAAYLLLPIPETTVHDWPTILDKGLQDLMAAGCWSQFNGNEYLNAYVCDYKTPPEIMVQLAVLLPILDYEEWSGADVTAITKPIRKALPLFYNKKLGTIMRWLPAAEDRLDGSEEHKKPGVMDAWYLHHPLLNLSRLALKGDSQAKKLFLDSVPYAMKVARHFKYEWPVFYDMETLSVIKKEAAKGKGGEKDVAGIYAHVMLQAYEITGDKKYVKEAERAARTLKGKGFELLYQANNTAFSAGALLRLHKLTGKEIYLQLSYLCFGNLFKNVKLWDCNYGHGKHFPSFFALFPLNDAPYTAVYEEQEVFCAIYDYLQHAEGVTILPSLQLLLAEFVRHFISRAAYYYPPMLPEDALSEEVKTGEISRNLWIALEDLHDGWEKNGEVGQEVYGAGNAFGILPRQCIQLPGGDYRVIVDYPFTLLRSWKNNRVSFHLKGDARLQCRLIVTSLGKRPAAKVAVYSEKNGPALKGVKISSQKVEYLINGDRVINIYWR